MQLFAESKTYFHSVDDSTFLHIPPLHSRETHVRLWGAVQVVEEDGAPPVHPVDAVPDTDASPGLLVSSVLKKQPCLKQNMLNPRPEAK